MLDSGITSTSASPIHISADSVGPIATSMSLRALREQYPQGRDTLYHEHEATFPALLIPLGEVKVLAVQSRMDDEQMTALRLRPECVADFWVVSGAGAILPGGGRTGAPWQELVERYGPAQGHEELSRVRARLEQLPGWLFDLNVDEKVLAAVQDSGIAAVPQQSRIWHVFVPPPAVPAPCIAAEPAVDGLLRRSDPGLRSP